MDEPLDLEAEDWPEHVKTIMKRRKERDAIAITHKPEYCFYGACDNCPMGIARHGYCQQAAMINNGDDDIPGHR